MDSSDAPPPWDILKYFDESQETQWTVTTSLTPLVLANSMRVGLIIARCVAAAAVSPVSLGTNPVNVAANQGFPLDNNKTWWYFTLADFPKLVTKAWFAQGLTGTVQCYTMEELMHGWPRRRGKRGWTVPIPAKPDHGDGNDVRGSIGWPKPPPR